MVKPLITLDIYYLIVLALGVYLLYLVFDRFIFQRKEFLEVTNTNNNDDLKANNDPKNNENDIIAGPNGPMSTSTETDDSKNDNKNRPVEGSCECKIRQTLKGHLCYTSRKIRKYAEQNALLKHYINGLLKQADDPNNYHLAYRKRLSNKYYPVKPALAHTDHAVLNLRDEDFSTKTFSESKFLAPTKKSSYYGKDTHYGSYLCDDMYPYNDSKLLENQQFEFTPAVKLY